MTGSFEIEEVDGVDVGTTIILHLKQDCREYADEERIKGNFLHPKTRILLSKTEFVVIWI